MQAAVAVAMPVLFGGSVILHGYVMCFPDDVDTLPDALDSMARFCDHIYLVDGGFTDSTLCKQPRYTASIKDWLPTRREFSGYGMPFFTLDTLPWSDEEIRAFKEAYEKNQLEDRKIVPVGDMTLEISGVKWNGVPLTVWENDFTTPGSQRNFVLSKMLQEPEQPDWIVWCDSDEIFSNEFIADVRSFLEGLSPDVSNVCPKWLTLVEDEQHYAPEYSNFLSHARIHHPSIAYFTDTWHEHMHYVGKRVDFDRYIVHTRMLFRRRLFIQRSHAVINEGAWAGVTSYPVPAGVTWNLHWPEGEPVGMPINADIRTYENGVYAK